MRGNPDRDFGKRRVWINFGWHFFERYYERLHRNVNAPVEWIMKFMEDIRFFVDEKLEEVSPGYYKVMACIANGACLGYYDAATKMYIYKTFLREDMLFDDQLQVYKKMKELWKRR